ncbi:transcription factor S-II, central domain-containing protein [Lipomyces kononenkoae]|uniref:Transcription factor S-II, central domain-containing protein n=1 Tax=Lipomyces kononenkoae TaxID=34357 RepID=A0ACC3T3T1_LIPKO
MEMASTEPRRSSRSNKGQHSQTFTEVLEPTDMRGPSSTSRTTNRRQSEKKKPKPRSRRTKKQSEEEEQEGEESHVRCVCGLETTDPEDDKSLMVQCEKCLCWQHPECTMGITDEAEVPDQYFCERCRPDLHETYAKTIESQKLATTASEKEQDYKSDTGADGESRTPRNLKTTKHKLERSPSIEVPEEPIKVQKRERQDSVSDRADGSVSHTSVQQAERQQPQRSLSGASHAPLPRRKSSAATVPKAVPLPAKVDHVDDLADKVRKSVAKGILNLLEKAADTAITNDAFKLAEGTSVQEFAEKLSLEIEYSMYEQLAVKTDKDVGHKYRDKFRTILFNLKDTKNSVLRQRVLSGEITPDHLVRMAPEEMMNPELQKLAEAVRAESISQSILKKVEAPRIRRTHKGEEFVGDVDPMVTLPENAPEADEGASSRDKPNAEMRSPHIANDNVYSRRSVSPFTAPEQSLPAVIADNDSRDRSQSLQPPDIGETYSEDRRSATPSATSAAADRTDFDIDRVWKSVDSPPPSERRSSFSASHLDEPVSPQPQVQNHGQVIDEDIDRLINDDDLSHNRASDDDYDHSYSPMLEPQESVIWEGLISMAGVSEFMGTAVQVGGPLFDDEVRRWQDVIAQSIDVDGRLSKDTAANYLSEVSSTKDLVAVSFTVKNPELKEQERAFTRLFDYFRGRDRYGVIRNKFANVKDAYLVPLLPADPRPDYMHMISSINIPRIVTRPLLLGIFVINKVNSATRTAFSGTTDHHNGALLDSDEYDPTATPIVPSISSEVYGNREQWQPSRSIDTSALPSSATESPEVGLLPSGAVQNIRESLMRLSLPETEVALLQKILESSAEVIQDPSLINDPNFLIKVVQDYQRMHL